MQETVLQLLHSLPREQLASFTQTLTQALSGACGNDNNMEFIFSSLERNIDFLQLWMCISQSSDTSLPKEMDKSACLEQRLDQLWTCVWATEMMLHSGSMHKKHD